MDSFWFIETLKIISIISQISTHLVINYVDTTFFNWIECTFEEYERSCLKYGYNCESSPAFIKFMLQLGAPLRFFSYKVKGNIVGSICVDQGWIANDIKNKKNLSAPYPYLNAQYYCHSALR
jgi:hypothetical protein